MKFHVSEWNKFIWISYKWTEKLKFKLHKFYSPVTVPGVRADTNAERKKYRIKIVVYYSLTIFFIWQTIPQFLYQVAGIIVDAEYICMHSILIYLKNTLEMKYNLLAIIRHISIKLYNIKPMETTIFKHFKYIYMFPL